MVLPSDEEVQKRSVLVGNLNADINPEQVSSSDGSCACQLTLQAVRVQLPLCCMSAQPSLAWSCCSTSCSGADSHSAI